MASLAKAQIIGHVGRDPEVKVVKDFTITNFSVAVSEKIKGQDKTTWFKISIFGNQGEFILKYVKKGSLVFVDGRLGMNEYQGKDGVWKSAMEITASDVKLLSSKRDGEPSILAIPLAKNKPAYDANEDSTPF